MTNPGTISDTRAASQEQRGELDRQRRKVDFDTYDITVSELLRRLGNGRFEIAPAYQRQFRWSDERQSRLVESVLLGIPVPPLFMATNKAADQSDKWEVVDGLQRLLSLANFAGDDTVRQQAKLGPKPLVLRGLDKLDSFDGYGFADLPPDIQTALEDRPIRVVVLNDKSDLQVRFDLFERLNTGGVSLSPHEIRESVFRGPFIDLVADLAEAPEFKDVVRLSDRSWKDGTPGDYVLRFFAYHDRYRLFEHSVEQFLNEFARDANAKPREDVRRALFFKTFGFLREVFPNGIKSRKGTTPANLFEAVSVGAALALEERPDLTPTPDPDWLRSEELRFLTTGATNSRSRVQGRIEYCRDRFLDR